MLVLHYQILIRLGILQASEIIRDYLIAIMWNVCIMQQTYPPVWYSREIKFAKFTDDLIKKLNVKINKMWLFDET